MSEENEISWWDWITATAPRLVAKGVPSEEVKHERNLRVGLTRSLSRRWARVVGLWGGQKTIEEIAELIGVTLPTVRSQAQYWGLKYRRKSDPAESQVQVALRALVIHRQGTYDLRRKARDCGILPPEFLYYVEYIVIFEDLILSTEGLDLAELIEEYGMDAVQDMWLASGYALVAPWKDADGQAELLAGLRGGEPPQA